jgi:hypothetical protein
VRQEDSLLPILFNFMINSLTKMMDKAYENSVLKSLGRHLIPNRVILLHYADNTTFAWTMIYQRLEILKCCCTSMK